ncbi:MAG: hypothetical protein ABR518_04355 [Actinomycetota bacterium]
MDVYLIVLRILHILAGVFWVGSSLMLFFFVQPTAKALGPQGGPFMGHLTQQRKLPVAITVAGAVTVLAGLLLYWESSAGLDGDWITSGPGLSLTVGGLFALTAFVIGLLIVRPTVDRMGAVAGAVQASGGPPSEAQAAELQRLQGKLRALGTTNSALLILAVAAMAAARYV